MKTAPKKNDASESSTRASLLERIRDGSDTLAWRDFFDRYWRSLYSYAQAHGCSHDMADEVVQNTLLTMFQKRQVFQYDPSLGQFRHWLRKVLHRHILIQHRRRRNIEVVDDQLLDGLSAEPGDIPSDLDWDQAFERSLLLGLLEVIRREVSPETYQAFELTVLHEVSGKDAAKITGLSRNAVYLARKRITDRLRSLGASYKSDGELNEVLRQAVKLAPPASVERRLTRLLVSGQHLKELEN